jgi:hypothetical protein
MALGVLARGLVAAAKAIRAAAKSPVVRRATVKAANKARSVFYRSKAKAREICERTAQKTGVLWRKVTGRVNINPPKQLEHVKGTREYLNRIKRRQPTSYFDDAKTAEQLSREAWQKGRLIPGRPNVREYDFGRPIGTGPKGGTQTRVRVHKNTKEEIHGHPAGPEI